MNGFVIVGAVGLIVMVACFVAVIHTARREVERLTALLHVQAAANDKLRERVKQLHWEKAEIWQWLNAPEEADDAPAQDAA